HPQGGNGLNPETAWYVTLPVDAFAITGGQLAYTVTATTVPEPGTVAMLLLGLGLVGTVTRRRARG
ncbi:MAG: PEPxxWA-CTERM sorting domain-containing protein, partial [Azoarcus sp.]|nr:PEPxxWA-CTERM sorting domain-containing protein [Azoarcus sp.]